MLAIGHINKSIAQLAISENKVRHGFQPPMFEVFYYKYHTRVDNYTANTKANDKSFKIVHGFLQLILDIVCFIRGTTFKSSNVLDLFYYDKIINDRVRVNLDLILYFQIHSTIYISKKYLVIFPDT